MKFEDAIKAPITVLTGTKDSPDKVDINQARIGVGAWALVAFAGGSVLGRKRQLDGKKPILGVLA